MQRSGGLVLIQAAYPIHSFSSFQVNILKSSLDHERFSFRFDSKIFEKRFQIDKFLRLALYTRIESEYTRDFTSERVNNALTNCYICHLSARVRTCTTAPDPIGTRVTSADQTLVFTICLANDRPRSVIRVSQTIHDK